MDALQLAGYIFGSLATGAACYERWRSEKALRNSAAAASKDELITVLTETSNAYKEKSDREHNEFMAYRKEIHDKSTEIQAQFLQLNKENMELRARTDITQVMQTQQQILDSLGTMTNVLKLIQENLTANRSS